MSTAARTTLERGHAAPAKPREDAIPKVTGEFAYSSDLQAADMLWGHTVRSPHAHARILEIDVSEALGMPGVHAVLTHEDVPGKKLYGLEFPDQPVLAIDRVRYFGEAVAIVAAEEPEQARRAAAAVRVEYEPLEPVVDPERATEMEPLHVDWPVERHGDSEHPQPNVVRALTIRRGDPDAAGDVTVSGYYEIGQQDQAFLGPESGIAIPDGEGGVDIHVATQWLHVDRDQIAPCLGLQPEQVRIHLAGVGGAFGGREDLSIQAHAALLALRPSRPVKMVYNREESFVGHIHRHPARIWAEHRATAAGQLVAVRMRILLDGGAYASSSTAVISNACSFAVGPYAVRQPADRRPLRVHEQPALRRDARVRRGAGVLRRRGADGQARRRARDRSDRAPASERARARRRAAHGPGAHGLAADEGRDPTRRGTADSRAGGRFRGRRFACPAAPATPPGEKAFNAGSGSRSGSRTSATPKGSTTTAPPASVCARTEARTCYCAAAEVGQGVSEVILQVARLELGTDDVALEVGSTASVGSAGSSSASRMTWMAAGAVQLACQAALEERERTGGEVDVERVYRHPETSPLDSETGQVLGERSHVAFAVAAMRVVVEVDVELGLTRVVWIGTAQDVGNALNPQAVEGQIEGGTAQGLGLALMEEIQTQDGVILNPNFTDYLIPTFLDMPPVVSELVEEPEPSAPYGVKGVGEPPTVVSTAAIVAALRDATGRELTRVPVRPDDIVGL